MKQNIRWMGIIVALVGLCIVALVFIMVFQKPGSMVRIYQDGKLLQELPLDEDTALTVPGPREGYNKVVIQDGEVSVTEANCPDQICVQHIPISETLTQIVCLPNRLVVQVEAGEDPALDQVS